MQIFAILHFTLNLPVVEHLCDTFCKYNTNIDAVAESHSLGTENSCSNGHILDLKHMQYLFPVFSKCIGLCWGFFNLSIDCFLKTNCFVSVSV